MPSVSTRNHPQSFCIEQQLRVRSAFAVKREVHTRAGFSCMACLVLIRGLHHRLIRLNIRTVHM